TQNYSFTKDDRFPRFIMYYMRYLFAFFFFFQAEDGIRDGHVTGVQTCALPISFLRDRDYHTGAVKRTVMALTSDTGPAYEEEMRSEERRVGKECRCRWSRDH